MVLSGMSELGQMEENVRIGAYTIRDRALVNRRFEQVADRFADLDARLQDASAPVREKASPVVRKKKSRG